MFTNPAPLALTVEALRKGEADLIAYVDEMCDRVEKLDPEVEAILPAENMRKRLHAEAKDLLLFSTTEKCAKHRCTNPFTSIDKYWRHAGVLPV